MVKVRKNVSIDYEVWKAARIYAAKNDLTVSEVIERAVKKFLEEESHGV